MQEKVTWNSHKALILNTTAFTVCFAVWMLNGVLVTFLASTPAFDWSTVEIGWLLGIPVLTGSIFRLPAGILTDKFGGKPVFGALLFIIAVPMFLLSYADTYLQFALCSFGFGLAGVSFAIGIAYTSVWYPMHRQGIALGIFGAGNAGAALTTLLAPTILKSLTDNGRDIDEWRKLPLYYAILLVVMGIIFVTLSTNKKPASSTKTFGRMLEPLKSVRVWRFGLYYFLVFGCFVAFSQWLVPYFVNVYDVSLVTAGILAACFSFPSGVIRGVGGWLADKLGARTVMYWVLGTSLIISAMVTIPRMTIESPGPGVLARQDGTVKEVSAEAIVVAQVSPAGEPLGDKRYELVPKPESPEEGREGTLILPTKDTWQEPNVEVGSKVTARFLLARGRTRIFFQANIWVFAALVILLGSIWGIGKAAVYKYIPDYFPEEVGVVGGMVGVLGGLGGFVGPIVFGYLLAGTGLWTSSWMFIAFISLLCLSWMHLVIRRVTKERTPEIADTFETDQSPARPEPT